MQIPCLDDVRIGVVGLGYVGLPLSVYMARHFPVMGFDVDRRRIDELKTGKDATREVLAAEFESATHFECSADANDLADVNFYIVTVPTPIDAALQPDLGAVKSATETVAGVLKPGNVVVYESTVYPGLTEDVCVPILEQVSGLTFGKDFFVGYSPERINPGDREHRLPDIVKITSGSTPEVADLVDAVYARIITAGTHKARSIKVAEAAKVIENVQRDVNIALINELAQLFKRLDIETSDVLAAASTKWNFHRYTPGLVGGHCIGVDPYYLTHKANAVGFHPGMVLAGRRINDDMPKWVVMDVVKTMLRKKIEVSKARVLVMGLTFKENCPDIRNTKVVDLVNELKDLVAGVDVVDPWADVDEVAEEYGIELKKDVPAGPYDAIVLTVRHEAYMKLGEKRLREMLKPQGILYDLKNILPAGAADAQL